MYSGGVLAFKDAVVPKIDPIAWRTFEEPLDSDDFTGRIVEHVKAGGSACVLGGAGTGKSVCLRAVRAALQEQGLQVACIYA